MKILEKLTVLSLFLLIINVSLSAQEKKLELKELRSKIIAGFDSLKGNCALAFLDLSDPSNVLLINENESFHAASTMKTPVMIEVFKQAHMGKFSLDDSIVVRNQFKSIVDGSYYSMAIDRDGGEGLYGFLNKKRTIRELVYEMITVSSNLATNILIGLVDAKNVQNTMLELGAANIKVLRGVEDIKAFDMGLNNTTTAKDLMLIFEQLANGTIVSKEDCQEMTKILLDQKFNEMIPAKLPQDVRVAHKTGSVDGIMHDSGIVMLPDGRKYILVILSRNLQDMKQAGSVLSGLSRLVYDYYTCED